MKNILTVLLLLTTMAGIGLADDGRIRKLLPQTLAEQHLLRNAEIKDSKITINFREGLRFAAEVDLTLSFPALYENIHKEADSKGKHMISQAVREQLLNELDLAPADLHQMDRIFISEMTTKIANELNPAVVQSSSEGQKLNVHFPDVRGRLAGAGLELTEVSPPRFPKGGDWPPGERLPPDAKVFRDTEDFAAKVKEAVASEMNQQIAQLRQNRDALLKPLAEATTGSWSVNLGTDELDLALEEQGILSGKWTRAGNSVSLQGTWRAVTPERIRATINTDAGPAEWIFEVRKDGESIGTLLLSECTIPTGEGPIKLADLQFEKIRAIAPASVEVDVSQISQPDPSSTATPLSSDSPTPTALIPSGVGETSHAQQSNASTAQGLAANTEKDSTRISSNTIQPELNIGEVSIRSTPGVASTPSSTGSTPTSAEPRTPAPGLLSPDEVAMWGLDQVQFAINEIYARHGLVFRNKEIQRKFEQNSWYRPDPNKSMEAIEASFTNQQIANLFLLMIAREAIRNSDAWQSAARRLANESRLADDPAAYVDAPAGTGLVGRFLLVGSDQSGRPVMRATAATDDADPVYVLANSEFKLKPSLRLSSTEQVEILFDKAHPIVVESPMRTARRHAYLICALPTE